MYILRSSICITSIYTSFSISVKKIQPYIAGDGNGNLLPPLGRHNFHFEMKWQNRRHANEKHEIYILTATSDIVVFIIVI